VQQGCLSVDGLCECGWCLVKGKRKEKKKKVKKRMGEKKEKN
jgi:hypothetical protein